MLSSLMHIFITKIIIIIAHSQCQGQANMIVYAAPPHMCTAPPPQCVMVCSPAPGGLHSQAIADSFRYYYHHTPGNHLSPKHCKCSRWRMAHLTASTGVPVHTLMSACVSACACVYTVCVRVYVRTCVRACVRVCVCTLCVYACVHVCVRACCAKDMHS